MPGSLRYQSVPVCVCTSTWPGSQFNARDPVPLLLSSHPEGPLGLIKACWILTFTLQWLVPWTSAAVKAC